MLFTTVSSFRQFGAWLDDASAATPGEGQTSVGIGHWRMNGMTQTNFPMIGMGLGVTDRLQVSASLPFYHASYDGVVARGIDDIYLSAKYVLVDPTLTLSEVGVAVSPVVEVLSAGAPDGRVHFAVPVNVEVRRLPFRVYGSAGYFTRGSVFAGGALEWTSPSRRHLHGRADPVVLDPVGCRAGCVGHRRTARGRHRQRRRTDRTDCGGLRQRRAQPDQPRGRRHQPEPGRRHGLSLQRRRSPSSVAFRLWAFCLLPLAFRLPRVLAIAGTLGNSPPGTGCSPRTRTRRDPPSPIRDGGSSRTAATTAA